MCSVNYLSTTGGRGGKGKERKAPHKKKHQFPPSLKKKIEEPESVKFVCTSFSIDIVEIVYNDAKDIINTYANLLHKNLVDEEESVQHV